MLAFASIINLTDEPRVNVARLDLVRLRPQIEEMKRGGKPDDGTMLRDSASDLYKFEDTCRIRIT